MFIHIICSGVTVSDDVTCSLFYGTQQLIKGTLHSYGTLLFSSDDWLDYTDLQFITLWRVIKMWGRPFMMNIYWKIFSFTFFVSNFHSDMHAMTETGWFGMWWWAQSKIPTSPAGSLLNFHGLLIWMFPYSQKEFKSSTFVVQMWSLGFIKSISFDGPMLLAFLWHHFQTEMNTSKWKLHAKIREHFLTVINV